MQDITKLEPKSVFYFFNEICKIPHGSGNVEQISNYLKEFAKERGLFCVQDEAFNIIIKKDATQGYENEEPVILQGHMDMVAVKKPDCEIDMRSQGLNVTHDGEFVFAEGTSLGGDDGAAVAYALAILDASDIPHPALEVVITVDEEVGMDGARALDTSVLKAHRLINIDSEDEGILTVSCAGGARVNLALPVAWSSNSGIPYRVKVTGLLGGHSGEEINKERGNSNCLMARALLEAYAVSSFSITSLEGGLADNAIPRETLATVLVSSETEKAFQDSLKETSLAIAGELGEKDPNAHIEVTRIDSETKTDNHSIAPAEGKRLMGLLDVLPNGVIANSKDIPGLVETSLNMGILTLTETLNPEFSVRSSVDSAKRALMNRLIGLAESVGGKTKVTGDYPGWAFRKNSPLRDKVVSVYKEMYHKDAKVEAIHAGLECGLLAAKIEDFDAVSIGPDMENIHTTEEKLSIASTQRTWEYLLRILAKKD